MITEDQFKALADELEKAGLTDKCHNNPSNLFIRGISGAVVQKIFEILPAGAWPDIVEVENPPQRSKSAPSGYIIVFRKEGVTQKRTFSAKTKPGGKPKSDGIPEDLMEE